MKLSIITINYNDAKGLEKTLQSVASQATGARLLAIGFELEHIIVDGASTDGSVDVIRDYESSIINHQSSIQLKWISEKDKGIYNAMNKGILMATGDYIQILNSGDCLYSDTVIADMYQVIGNRREAIGERPGIVYGNMIRDYGQEANSKRCEARGMRDAGECQKEWTMNDFIKGTINHDPTWIKRELYEKYGRYREDLPITADWRWFVEAVVFGGEKPIYVPIDVTLFDVTGISETQIAKREAEREEELRRIFPEAVLKDYWNYHFPINQIQRLKRHHIWGLVYFMERVLFKFEKWGILKR